MAVSAQERGHASYYHDKFHGRKTSSGIPYHRDSLTAAHRTLPFGTWIRVTSLADSSRSVVLKVTDRGPFVRGRVVDVSRAAAEQLDMIHHGVLHVVVEPIEQPGELPAGWAAPVPDSVAIFVPVCGLFQGQVAIAPEGFAVQIGAFTDQESALVLSGVLERVTQTIPLLHIGLSTTNTPIFRVLMGPFAERGQAETALLDLSQRNFGGFVIPLQNLR
jgi:rare lipoprotein A